MADAVPATNVDEVVVTAAKDTTQFGYINETSAAYSPLGASTNEHVDLTHANTTIQGNAGSANDFTGTVKDGENLTLNNVSTAQIGVAPNAKANITMNGSQGNDFFQVYDRNPTEKTGQANITINGGGGSDTVAITNVPADQVMVTGVAGNPNEVKVKAGANEYTLDNIEYLKGRPDTTAPAQWDQSKHAGPALPENNVGANLQDATSPTGPLADGKSATLAALLKQYDMGSIQKTAQYNQENGIDAPHPTNGDSGQLPPQAGGQKPPSAGPNLP